MNAAHVLKRCDEIANISAVMLAAAREGNWDEVDRLKARAGIAINEVRALADTVPLSAEEQQIKLVLMRRILENDGCIQELSHPWLRGMNRWLPGLQPPFGHRETIFK